MSENVQFKVTQEFSKLYTALSSRIEVFQTTQRDFLERLMPEIREVLPNLDESDLEVSAAIYGICITDDALKGYEVDQFAKDIRYLQSLVDEMEDEEPEEPEEPTPSGNTTDDENDDQPQYDEEGRPILQTPPSKREENFQTKITLAERAATAQATESAYMKVLTAYYQANSFIDKSMNDLQNSLVLHHVNNRPEVIIASLLIREHFLNIYDNVVEIYENVPIAVDLRFVTAQLKVALERVINPNSEIKSQAEYFEEIKEIYPLGHGSDLYWDLSEQTVYQEYYPKLKQLLQPQIEEARLEREEARQTMLNNMERAKSAPKQGSTESIRSKVDSLIFETLHFDRTFDDNSRIKMARAVESVLKRMALEEFGMQDIPEMEKFNDYFKREFFKPIFEEYPQMFLPFIDIRHYSDFVEDPLAHFEEHDDFIYTQFWFAMRKHGAKERPSPQQLAHAFSMVLHDILNNPKVRNFDY